MERLVGERSEADGALTKKSKDVACRRCGRLLMLLAGRRVAMSDRNMWIMRGVAVDLAAVTRVRAARCAEDVALRRWAEAVADYDRAIQRQGKALSHATTRVHRAMAPLRPYYFCRIEGRLLAEDYRGLARFDGRKVACVSNSRTAVDDARASLAKMTETEDAKVATARRARAEATADLVHALGMDRAALVAGLSPRLLGRMRSGR